MLSTLFEGAVDFTARQSLLMGCKVALLDLHAVIVTEWLLFMMEFGFGKPATLSWSHVSVLTRVEIR